MECMVILKVDIQIKPECVDAFKVATIENARNSALEAGVARFDFVQDIADPTHFVLWEVYHSEAAMPLHKETAHFKTWATTVADMFAEPRTRALFTNVFPGDEKW